MRMSCGRSFLSAIFLIFAIILGLSSARAQNMEVPFYKDKQVRLIIGSPVASSYDLWARIVARHMGKHIPGNPVIVPQNMPGSDGLVAGNYIYNVAPRDGLAFGTFSRNLPARALLKQPSVMYDPLKFEWIGSPELVNRICAALPTAPVKSPEDLFVSELLVGGVGAGSIQSTMPTILNKLLGMKFKVIEGYRGGAEVFLAMERGEIHGVCLSYSQLKGPHASWVSSGKIRVLFNMETKPFTEIPGVPNIYKYVKIDEHRQILEFVNSSIEMGRPFAAPPGVPAHLISVLRKAFAAMLQDPEFILEVEKQGYEIAYTPGEEIRSLVQKIYAAPAHVIERAQELSGVGRD